MSGGDFVSRSEAAICTRRRIEDRVAVVRDLERVVKRRGHEAAADRLGISAGSLGRVMARRQAITPALLVAMYGATGCRLLPGLGAANAIDLDAARVMAAARGRAIDVRAELLKVADQVPQIVRDALATSQRMESAVLARMPALQERPSPRPLPVQGGVIAAAAQRRPAAVEVAGLLAIARRAVAVHGSQRRAAEVIGVGYSSLAATLGGHRPITATSAAKLRAWDAANPVSSCGSEEAPPAAASDAVLAFDHVEGGADRAGGGADTPPPATDTVTTAAEALPPAPADLSVVAGVAPAGSLSPPAPEILTVDLDRDDQTGMLTAQLSGDVLQSLRGGALYGVIDPFAKGAAGYATGDLIALNATPAFDGSPTPEPQATEGQREGGDPVAEALALLRVRREEIRARAVPLAERLDALRDDISEMQERARLLHRQIDLINAEGNRVQLAIEELDDIVRQDRAA